MLKIEDVLEGICGLMRKAADNLSVTLDRS